MFLLDYKKLNEYRSEALDSLVPVIDVCLGLKSYIYPHQYSYPSIFIYGHRASGKSHVMHVLMKELEVREISTPFHCLDTDASLLSALLRLQELVEDNVTVILLSEIAWDKFRPNTGCFEPLLLHFPDYSKSELQQILSQNVHPSYSAGFYSAYINILLGVFYSVCRDLRELRHLAALNFSKFCEPLAEGKVKETDTHKLWKHIEPHLKKAMQTVYLREVSSLQWEQMQQMEEEEAGALRGLSAHTHVELPYYSKFLLIAAYLASYNPARTDKRFFLKHHGKIRKTNFLKKNEKTSNHLLGPKPFPLDRLLAIFYSVVDSRVAPTASIFSQISSLVTLQLLAQVSHDDQLDAPKYKCAVSLDFICAIARTVNFDIVKYLYDFL
uniref:Origin recognition complex, subunit 5 n=1 Tax=Oreochromis niloticus TaxID=8128 RepID=A0A669BHY0_ORENI